MPADSTNSPAAPGGFDSGTTLGFIAYVIFPTLAVITAIFGVILATRDNLAGSLLFFGLLQVWLLGGILVHIRRRRVISRAGENSAEGEEQGAAA